MNVYSLESFVTFCDEYQVANEGLKDVWNRVMELIHKLIEKIKRGIAFLNKKRINAMNHLKELKAKAQLNQRPLTTLYKLFCKKCDEKKREEKQPVQESAFADVMAKELAVKKALHVFSQTEIKICESMIKIFNCEEKFVLAYAKVIKKSKIVCYKLLNDQPLSAEEDKFLNAFEVFDTKMDNEFQRLEDSGALKPLEQLTSDAEDKYEKTGKIPMKSVIKNIFSEFEKLATPLIKMYELMGSELANSANDVSRVFGTICNEMPGLIEFMSGEIKNIDINEVMKIVAKMGLNKLNPLTSIKSTAETAILIADVTKFTTALTAQMNEMYETSLMIEKKAEKMHNNGQTSDEGYHNVRKCINMLDNLSAASPKRLIGKTNIGLRDIFNLPQYKEAVALLDFEH